VCLLAGLAISGVGFGQIPDSLPRRDDLVGEILIDIYRTKIASAIEMGLNFASYWDSGGLNAQQKKHIENIYRSMQERKMPANPYLLGFISTISLAGGNELIQLSAMTRILEMTGQVLTHENHKNVRNYFRNLNVFLGHKALHHSNGFKLYVDNIDFEFEYVTSAQVLPEEDLSPAPEQDTGDQTEDDAGGWEDDTGDLEDDGWGDAQDSGSDPDNWENTWNNSMDSEGQQSGTDLPPIGNDRSLIESIVNLPVPEEKGPVIRFKSTDLIFLTNYDSISLQSSKGFFSLTDGLYVGEGGTFNWSSFGLNSRTVFCILGKYAFETNKPELISTKSKLTFSDKIEKPIEGTFTYRSIKRRLEEKSTYPRFLSYENNIRVYFPMDKNLIFRGGFSLFGDKVFSNSLLNKNSVLEVQDETGILYRAISPKFGLSDSLITSSKAEIKIYHDRDSITHPEVRLRYDPNKRELLVYRDEGVYRLSPYRVSYFDMNIAADMILWDLDEDSLDISISSARNIVPAYFESNEFFNRNDMKSLAGIYDFHPLIMVVQYARKIRSKNFNAFDMAHDLRQNAKEVTAAMVGIMQNGFIDYNSQTGEIVVKDKAFHFVDANRYQKDYDDLRIKSLSPLLPNATIRLEEKEMTIRGIERFNVSEILGVFIFPKNSEITVLKDRDLKFNGQLYAGNFEFIGQEFLFKYDSFLWIFRRSIPSGFISMIWKPARKGWSITN
jgi:hypothetical protein